jgi:transposase-like protein
MRRYHSAATEGEPVVLKFDREEIEHLVNQELHRSALTVGVAVIAELMEEQVLNLCGGARKRSAERRGHRYGHQRGYVVIGAQKVAIDKPRVRSIDGRREIRLALYERLQRRDVIDQRVMHRLLYGVSCRNYRSVIETIQASIGVSRSSVSRSFIRSTEQRVREFAARRFDGTRFVAIVIDGVRFKGQTLIVAMGVDAQGCKRVLAVRQGATENARVCCDLLEELREHGVSTETATLFILDGSKALRAAVERVWGSAAVVQRCRLHKMRNVHAYVPDQLWPDVQKRMRDAYAELDYTRAKRILETTARWLERVAPAAARSLREGLEETLTITHMALPRPLRRSLMSTNIAESPFGRLRNIARRVTRWQNDMRVRWCIAGLIEAERSFNRIGGASLITKLVDAVDRIQENAA